MEVKIVSAQNETKKSKAGKKYTAFVVKAIKLEDNTERTWNIFPAPENEELRNKFLSYVDKNADVKMEKDGQFWNPVDVTDLVVAPTSGGYNPGDKQRSKEEMRRGMALEIAAHLVAATLTSKSNPTEAMQVAIELSKDILGYLENDDSDVYVDPAELFDDEEVD